MSKGEIMNNDFWNYLVSCEYTSKMQNGRNNRQKKRNEEYSVGEWVCAVIAGVLVLVGMIVFSD